MPKKSAEIFRSRVDVGMLEVRFSEYIRDIRDELVMIRPQNHRRWCPERKVWLVEESHLEELVRILQRYNIEIFSPDLVEDEDEEVAGPYRVLYLHDDAPNEVIQAVYRALAMLNHPDKGGDVARMAAINNAYRQIKSERGI